MKIPTVKIAFCENGAGYGGAIISLAAFLEKLPKEFEAHIYTGIGTGQYQELSKLGSWRHLPQSHLINPVWLKYRGLPFASNIDNVFNLAPYALRFWFAFKRDRIDIVYLNNDPSCNLAAALAAKLAGLPIILHARGFSTDTKGNRWVLDNIDHCIAVSGAVRTQLIDLGLHPEKCTVVPEGLDMTQFYPRSPVKALQDELELSETTPVLTLVGGLIDWKGQDILLEASPMVFEKFPTAQVLLVGSAYGRDNGYSHMIAKRAAMPDLQGKVHLLGARKDIPDILSISTIVLHTSTKPEPFGRTFLEGMAMGKPVIASNEGGPPEVIEHEVDGLLVEPREPEKLAGSINRLLSEPAFAAAIGRNAAKKAASYSIENHTAMICDILRKTRLS